MKLHLSVGKTTGCLFLITGSFSTSSCFLLESTPAPAIIKDLELCADYRWGLFGVTVVEGSVKNNYWTLVKDIKLRATVTNTLGEQLENYEFVLSVPLTTDGKATFKETLSTPWKNVSTVKVEIIDAST